MIFGQKMMFETRSYTKWGKKIIDILFNILFSLVIKQKNSDVQSRGKGRYFGRRFEGKWKIFFPFSPQIRFPYFFVLTFLLFSFMCLHLIHLYLSKDIHKIFFGSPLLSHKLKSKISLRSKLKVQRYWQNNNDIV